MGGEIDQYNTNVRRRRSFKENKVIRVITKTYKLNKQCVIYRYNLKISRSFLWSKILCKNYINRYLCRKKCIIGDKTMNYFEGLKTNPTEKEK